MPNLQIGVKRIEVIPIATITDTNGRSFSREWEKSVSTQHSFNVGLSGSGGVEGSAASSVPSGSVSANWDTDIQKQLHKRRVIQIILIGLLQQLWIQRTQQNYGYIWNIRM